MIEVELPDGTIVEFPEGTSQEVMRSALQRRFGQQTRPAQEAAPQERTFRDALIDNVVGRDDGVTSYGEKLGTLLNMGGESLTMGLVGDEAAAGADAALGRGSYDENLARYRGNEAQMEAENPLLSLAARVAPALIPGAGAAKFVGGAASLPGAALRSGLLGAAGGGAYGFMEGEGGVEDRVTEAEAGAKMGGLLGGSLPFAGRAVQGIADSVSTGRQARAIARNAPTTDQLRAQGRAAYQAVDDAGVQIKPEVFRDQVGRMSQTAQRAGLDQLPGPGSLTPRSARVMQIADEMSDGLAANPNNPALPFSSLDQLRRHAGTAASDIGNRTEASIGSRIIEELDGFVQRLGPDDVVAGDANALKTAIPKAREIWTRMSRSQILDDAIDASENYLGGQASGLRNQFASILRNKKLAKSFSEPEKKIMRRVVNGSAPQQLLNLLGGGIGQLATMGTGAAVGGVPGMLAGAGGAALARKGSEALAMRNAEFARAVIAGGGLLAPQTQRAAPAIQSLLFSGAPIEQQMQMLPR